MNADAAVSVVRADSESGATRSSAVAIHPRWIVVVILACVAAPLGIFSTVTAELFRAWQTSDTFAHCFFVFPAFAYLIWTQRTELRSCPLRPAPVALLGVFASGFVVALGSLAAALTPSFFGLICMSVFTVIAVLGWRLAMAMWVPLLFLFFAIPFGEVFVPYMIDWTADFTVAAVSASGVPVFREGPNFVIPSGSWSVVDACSGIRYLLASMFAGWLYAWLIYRSAVRRLAFMAASIVVPIFANWLRAYIIVMLGHLSGNRIATGIDHLIYGWIFFGVIIGLMFWMGSFFREDIGRTTQAREHVPPAATWNLRSVLAAGIAALVIAAGWHIASSRLAERSDLRPVVLHAIEPSGGWNRIFLDSAEWSPGLRAPAATLATGFEKDGRRVLVHIGFYRDQSQDSEVVNSLNDLTAVVGKRWLVVSRTNEIISLGQEWTSVASVLARQGDKAIVFLHWYWVDGQATTSDAEAKARLAIDRLLGRSDTSAWVGIYAIDAEDGKAARAILVQFASEMGPAIEAALRETAAR